MQTKTFRTYEIRVFFKQQKLAKRRREIEKKNTKKNCVSIFCQLVDTFWANFSSRPFMFLACGAGNFTPQKKFSRRKNKKRVAGSALPPAFPEGFRPSSKTFKVGQITEKTKKNMKTLSHPKLFSLGCSSVLSSSNFRLMSSIGSLCDFIQK